MKSTGLKRNNIDKFYTKQSVVEQCLTIFKKYIKLPHLDKTLIIEPSAGNGSFITGIKKISQNCLFFDLNPDHEDIIKQDYLAYNHSNNPSNLYCHVIGNPPFGSQSSLAIKFIKKSCEFADSFSFILPKSFKKKSLQSKIPLEFHLLSETDLEKNSFLVENKQHDVPCVFQIWIKKDYNRILEPKIQPEHFIFVKKNENPSISVRRVGSNAGKISVSINNKNIQSHYFIKFINSKSLEENIKSLTILNYEFNNTVGPKSISKQELIDKFNTALQD